MSSPSSTPGGGPVVPSAAARRRARAAGVAPTTAPPTPSATPGRATRQRLPYLKIGKYIGGAALAVIGLRAGCNLASSAMDAHSEGKRLDEAEATAQERKSEETATTQQAATKDVIDLTAQGAKLPDTFEFDVDAQHFAESGSSVVLSPGKDNKWNITAGGKAMQLNNFNNTLNEKGVIVLFNNPITIELHNGHGSKIIGDKLIEVHQASNGTFKVFASTVPNL